MYATETESQLVFGFDDHANAQDVTSAIEDLSFVGTPTSLLTQALTLVSSDLLPTQGRSGPEVETLVVLLVADTSPIPQAATAALDAMRAEGVVVAAVVLGTDGASEASTAISQALSRPTASFLSMQEAFSSNDTLAFAQRAVCDLHALSFAVDLAAREVSITFSRAVPPVALSPLQLLLSPSRAPDDGAAASAQLSYFLQAPAASTQPTDTVAFAIPAAHAAALLTQSALLQSVSTTLLSFPNTTLLSPALFRLHGVPRQDALQASALVGPLRPYGVVDLVPVSIEPRLIAFSYERVRVRPQDVQSYSIWCAGQLDPAIYPTCALCLCACLFVRFSVCLCLSVCLSVCCVSLSQCVPPSSGTVST